MPVAGIQGYYIENVPNKIQFFLKFFAIPI